MKKKESEVSVEETMKIFDSEKRQTANARDLRERASQPAARGKENLEQD